MRRNKPEVQVESKEALLDRKSNDFADKVETVVKNIPVTESGYNIVLELRRTADDILAEIDSTFDPIIKLAYQSHKLAIKTKKDKSERLLNAKNLLNGVIVRYLREKDERERLERERLEAEAKREQEEQRVLMAATLIENGKEEEAVTLLEMELPAPVVATLPVERESSEVWTRELYSCEVIDMQKLVTAWTYGSVPQSVFQINQVFLDKCARDMKEEFNFPGCRLVKKSSAPVLKKS